MPNGRGGRTDVGAGSGARVNGDDDSALEAKGEGGRTVIDLDPTRGILRVVRVQAEERRRLKAASAFDQQRRATHVEHGRDLERGHRHLLDAPTEREGVAVVVHGRGGGSASARHGRLRIAGNELVHCASQRPPNERKHELLESDKGDSRFPSLGLSMLDSARPCTGTSGTQIAYCRVKRRQGFPLRLSCASSSSPRPRPPRGPPSPPVQ